MNACFRFRLFKIAGFSRRTVGLSRDTFFAGANRFSLNFDFEVSGLVSGNGLISQEVLSCQFLGVLAAFAPGRGSIVGKLILEI